MLGGGCGEGLHLVAEGRGTGWVGGRFEGGGVVRGGGSGGRGGGGGVPHLVAEGQKGVDVVRLRGGR
jgi:hypothetical protein